ncbi:MAG: hypothetical protein COB60_02930 [Flavobacteriaceae bacterium]|nr:MAG: hypothetical protein COB60_07640 [Flavobacteriaceae bacterium]PCI35473.1 MAG: hypothetical protein COB60_02930 [Flavobacteriaceae bacterium]
MENDFLQEMGYMALATRLKRLSDKMTHSGRQMYKDLSMDIEPNWFVIFKILQKHERLSVMEIAKMIHFSHPSVVVMVKKMMQSGYLFSMSCPDDMRKQLLELTPKAHQKLPQFETLWEAGVKGVSDTLKNTRFLEELNALENAFDKASFKERTLDALYQKQIVLDTFQEKYARDFGKLNYEWLEKYFEIEAHDSEMLDNPTSYIIDKGGEIIVAIDGTKIIGTVALLKINDGLVELAKMAVTEGYQGKRIGIRLLKKAIDCAQEMGFKTIMLESNRTLTPALTLYRKFGFVEVALNPNTPYKRADIKMELKVPSA